MSIVSISRLQVRRGLKVDLPLRLHDGEFGWCLDTRELFIGNGSGFNGNSEILTQWGQNDQIITHTYQGNTTVPASATPRPLGKILDDIVSVKDYGAQGDGVTDDTVFIQNAIDDVWNSNTSNPGGQASFKAIYFPAGIYLISNTIYVRPYVGLVGEGSSRTIFKMGTIANNPTCLISTADSLGQTQTSIGLQNAVLPNGILLKGFEVNSNVSATLNGIVLQRTSDLQIDDILTVGNWTTGQNPITSNVIPFTSGIVIQTLGSMHTCDTINITNYRAKNIARGLFCNDIARYIVLDKFDINNCFGGAIFDKNTAIGTNGPGYVRITNGTFRNLDYHGIYTNAPNCGLVSSNNSFDTVGNVNSVDPIMFSSNTRGCASINDTFSNSIGNLISIGNPQLNLFISPQQTSISSNAPIPIGPITLLDNSTDAFTGISYLTSQYTSIFINYNINRGVASRSGKLMIVTNGTDVDFEDWGIDLNADMYGTVGVIWSMSIVANAVNINYNTSSTGTNGTLTFIETKW